MKKKLFLFALLSILLLSNIFSESTYLENYSNLRKAVYNNLDFNIDEIFSLYFLTTTNLDSQQDDIEYYLKLSQCDYLMGLAYSDINDKKNAIKFFDKSIEEAKKSLEIKETELGFVCLAESISRNCLVKNVAYVLANGLEVINIAKKALSLNPQCGAARYLICSAVIYAPKPFMNFKKGEREILDLLENYTLDEEDYFNTYRTIGYLYYQQNKNKNANEWFEKAYTIYPNNIFLQNMMSGDYNQKEFISIDPVDTILEN